MFKFGTNMIIGHRGCSLVDQNNTVEAFEKAVECGAQMVEMDIRKTRDDVLVVFHDERIGGERIRGCFYEDLVEVAKEEGLVLPTLEMVLMRLEGKVFLDLELKESGYEEQVLNMVLKFFAPGEFVVTSFLDEVVYKVKKHFPTVTCGLILGIKKSDNPFNATGYKYLRLKFSEFFPWKRMVACRADFLAVSRRILGFGLIDSAWRRGVPLVVWTVNNPLEIKEFLRNGKIAGIASDRPDLVERESNAVN